MDSTPKLSITDKILAKIFLPLFPKRVKPNHLTTFRLLMIPIIVVLFWLELYPVGGILFLIASFTDALDGAMARSRNQATDFGKMYDPLADKLLICTVVYILVLKYVDVYAAWIIIILEAIIILAIDGELSCHALWVNSVSVLTLITSASSFLNSSYKSAISDNSVGQTNVKSAG